MVLLVCFQVFSELPDALSENRNLDLRRPGVRFVEAVLPRQLCFDFALDCQTGSELYRPDLPGAVQAGPAARSPSSSVMRRRTCRGRSAARASRCASRSGYLLTNRSPLILGSDHTLSDQSLAQRADEGGRRMIDEVPGQRPCARGGALMAYGLDHREAAVAGRLCHVVRGAKKASRPAVRVEQRVRVARSQHQLETGHPVRQQQARRKLGQMAKVGSRTSGSGGRRSGLATAWRSLSRQSSPTEPGPQLTASAPPGGRAPGSRLPGGRASRSGRRPVLRDRSISRCRWLDASHTMRWRRRPPALRRSD